MKRVLRFTVGAMVTFIGLWLILALNLNEASVMDNLISGFGAALTLIFLSIICTAGISLIIWVPLIYFVGLASMSVWQFILEMSKGSPQTEPAQASSPGMTKDQQALVTYIKQARVKGLTDQEISTKLQYNGWAADHIKLAFNAVEG